MNKIISTLFIMVCMMFTFVTIGCNEPQNEPQVVNENPVFNIPEIDTEGWTQEGEIKYKFDNAFRCLIQISGALYSIPRYQEAGGAGELQWVWKNNGDIAVNYFGINYNFKNPFAFADGEFDGYEDIGGGYIMIWLNDELVVKKKSFLKTNLEYNKAYKKK